MAEQLFRRNIILHVIESVRAAEIGNAAFRGDTGSAEENHSGSIGQDGLQLVQFFRFHLIGSYSLMTFTYTVRIRGPFHSQR